MLVIIAAQATKSTFFEMVDDSLFLFRLTGRDAEISFGLNMWMVTLVDYQALR